ncbi:MAG: alanine:cation symporter family protein [Gammaproteobacteria bacterium]|nr:alanine:cation symporter family protein [Gammaproteobacteria bacterium]
MRRLLFLLVSATLWTSNAVAGDIDVAIEAAISPIANFVSDIIFYSVEFSGAQVPLIVVWLILAALLFTFYFRFVCVTGFTHAIRLVRGDYTDPNEKNKGEVSHFQALTTALSGTVGLGSIAGVAVAVSVGGPGATFWMIVAGLLGMSAKFVECTLAVKYRKINPDGSISGGPMYYLSRGLKEKGLGGLGKVMAVFFAVMCVGSSFGAGNLFQVNQAYSQFLVVTGGADSFFADKAWLFGITMAAIVGSVIIGGIKGIAHVTEKIVPFMTSIYVLAALVVIFSNYTLIPGAVSAIIDGAFSNDGMAGGFIGVLIQGFKRAAFAHEAGIGSAAIAHSAVRTNEPVTEGLVSLLEPFIATVIICSLTALVIVITGVYTNETGMGGVELTSAAFASTIPWFPYVLAVAVILFAFSTIISWSYYGVKAWTYLFGESRAADLTYKFIFCSVLVLGSTMQLNAVINFSDAMMFAMSVPNIVGLYILAPVVKAELDSYMARVKSGTIKSFRAVTA